MAKYKGKDLSLTIDGTEVNLEATSVVLDREDADTDAVTFGELGSGTPQQWFFSLEAVADYGTGSVWTLLWENSGDTIPYVLKPYGNITATADQPHFTGTATIVAKPPVGGAANEVFTFEARLDVVGEPVRKVTA